MFCHLIVKLQFIFNSFSMKKISLFFIITLLSLKMVSQKTSDNEVNKRLAILCKVWGYTKYYHSVVANGETQWDDVLLGSIDQTMQTTSNSEFSQVLLLLFSKAGEMELPTTPLPQIPDSLMMNIDISWFSDSLISDSVREILDTISNRFRPQPNFYVSGGVGSTPGFDNDTLYCQSGQYPAEPLRLLALFRFWNIINYFYPYKNIMDENWDSVLYEFIPQVRESSNKLQYHLSMREFTAHLNDGHGYFWSQTFNNWNGGYYTPFKIELIENQYVITKVIQQNNEFEPGDIILEIDKVSMEANIEKLLKYVHGSNNASVYKNFFDMLCYDTNTTVSVVYKRGNILDTAICARGYYTGELFGYFGPTYWDTTLEEGCNIGYVNMGKLTNDSLETIMDKLALTDAIVFDIRNYPNEVFANLIDYLFEDGINIANLLCPDPCYPGTFAWYFDHVSSNPSNSYQGKVILLFNELTMSQAEYTCMGLEQHPNSIKIGSQTAGADGNVTYIRLPGQIKAYFSGLGVFCHDFTQTQRIGIVPDIEIKPTLQGIIEQRDELLEAALDCSLIVMKKLIDLSKSERIKISPNPCTSIISYAISNTKEVSAQLYIIDITGKVYYTRQTNSNSGFINISSLKDGVYYLIYRNPESILSSRFIKY